MSRIVSLLPSSTEMVWALGQGHRMVARSHECDYPPEVLALPVVTEPKLHVERRPETGLVPTSAQIDAQLHALVREALAIYRVDAAGLDAVRPDVVITQTQCEVCAVSLRDVELAVLAMVSSRPCVVALQPNRLEDIFVDLRKVATVLGVPAAGDALDTFELEHGDRYPGIVRLWRDAWERFIPFLAYPAVIRKIVYTTNMVESVNYQMRKATKTRGHFPDDDLLYRSIQFL